jgi:hypothetical protein
VGEQLMVDYLFFSPVTGFGMTPEGLNEPAFSDFWFQNMTEGRRNGGGSMLGTERVRGRLYEVHLIRSFLLLPLEPGELLVPAIELEVSDSTFFRRRGTKTLASPTLKLDVRELPEEGRPSGFRPGNIGRFSISTNLEDGQLRVGDTGRLQVRIEGVGISSRIVPPDVSLPDGLRQFDPEDSVEDSRSRKGWMEAHMQRTIPFTPRREGSFEFRDVAFHYFDPWKEAYETVTASSASLLVEGSRPGAIPNQDSDEAREDSEADWLSALPGERRVRKKGRVFSRLEPFPASMGFYSLLAVPFLLVGGTAALRKFRAHREETAPDRKRAHAGKRTRKALKDLDPEDRESFSTMARLLRDFVTTKTGEACRGATIERVRNVAGQHFGRPGFQIGNLIEQAERARYGAAEDIDFASLRDDALKVLNEAQLTDPTEEAKA